MKVLLSLLILLSLSACAPPLPAGDMMPMTQVYNQIPANPELERKIKLGSVSVPEEAGGQIAPVTSDVYREALQNALLTSNMSVRAGDKEKYVLDATLLEVNVPMFGFSMKADSKAKYQLKRVDNGLIVVDENVSLPYTAEFAESIDGNQRARIATAKAIRENITHMIRILATKSKSELSGKGK